MAVNKGEIGIYGVLRRDGGDNVLANTDQIKDKQLNKTQEQLNQEAINNIDSKVDKVEGKSLVSDADITKLSELPNNDDLNNKLEAKLDKSSIESTITAGSNNPVSSAAINTYINNTVTTIKHNVTDGEWLPVAKGQGEGSVKIGYDDILAFGNYSQAEGKGTRTDGYCSHAEGLNSTAKGSCSHAEGFYAVAENTSSHAEGTNTHAKGESSHVEGQETLALGNYSHAEGYVTQVTGQGSHAQGYYNYDNISFIDMVGVGSNSSNNTNASVIYVGRISNGEINQKDPKNGYQYLINIGGYQGQAIEEGMKSVQEVIADLETNKVDKVEGKQLSTNDYTTAEKNKVAESINESATNTLINTAINNLTKNSVGLSNVDNTSDANKPISTATQGALDKKVDIVANKSLVANLEIAKLAGLKTQNELNISISDAKKSGTDAQTTINNHIKDTNNPHNVTKDQVGLSNVDNTADINKEVKTATQLKTTRNIWGKAFNGSADIEGDMNKVTEIYLTDGTKYAEPCTEEEINALFV